MSQLYIILCTQKKRRGASLAVSTILWAQFNVTKKLTAGRDGRDGQEGVGSSVTVQKCTDQDTVVPDLTARR